MLYNSIQSDVKSNIDVVGFIDDDERKIGKKIDRIQVYAYQQITEDLLKKKKVDAVVSAGNSGATMAAAIKYLPLLAQAIERATFLGSRLLSIFASPRPCRARP